MDCDIKDRRDLGPEAKEVYFLLPFAEYGTLQDVLDVQKSGHGEESAFTEKEALILFRGICRGVSVFHKANPPLALRDLKPPNVLLFGERPHRPVIADFGSVARARVELKERHDVLKLQQAFDSTSTILFRAPETFNLHTNMGIDERTDVWALGCILYAILFNTSPFEEAFQTGNVGLAVMSASTMKMPAGGSSDLKELVSFMLNVDPAFRPSIDDVLNRIDALVQSKH